MVTFSNSLVVNDKMSQRVGHNWVTDLMTKQRMKRVRRLCRMHRGNTQNCVVVPGASKTMAWCRGLTEAWTESSPLLPTVCVNLGTLFPSCGWSWVSHLYIVLEGWAFCRHCMEWFGHSSLLSVCVRQAGGVGGSGVSALHPYLSLSPLSVFLPSEYSFILSLSHLKPSHLGDRDRACRRYK